MSRFCIDNSDINWGVYFEHGIRSKLPEEPAIPQREQSGCPHSTPFTLQTNPANPMDDV
jgi:hypothetical protein